MLMNYRKTREKLNECSRVVIFPHGGSTYHIKRYLKEYAGLSKNQIQKALNVPSRWLCVSNDYPKYILYDSGMYLLKDDEDISKDIGN